MARTEGFWNNVGGYIKTIFPTGVDILINGLNKYLNFNSLSGAAGYGFRDNNGVMEFKDSAGDWQTFVGGVASDFLKTDQTVPQTQIIMPHLVNSQPSFGYTDGKLTTVTYANGFVKTISYNVDGTVDTIDYDGQFVKTLNWSGGVLDNITT